jgi:hypothetical protein
MQFSMIRQNDFIYPIPFSIFVFPSIDDINSYSASKSSCEFSVAGNESFYQHRRRKRVILSTSLDFIIMEEKGEL